MPRYRLEALQVAADDQNFTVSNTDQVVDGAPADLMAIDLRNPRDLDSFLRMFIPVLVGAGIDFAKYFPPSSKGEEHND